MHLCADPPLSVPRLAPTGHPHIDDDHDELLGLIEALRLAPDAQLQQAFDTLRARIAEHFATEDALMAQQDFSSRQCHLDEHAAVLQSFEAVGDRLREGLSLPARRMADALLDWLPEHVDALDRHLAKFLFFRQTGGAPVLLQRR